MTKSDLDKWRKYVPFFVFGLCVLLWFLVRAKSLAEAKLANEIIVPILASIGAFFYVGFDLGGPRWRKEIAAHVGKQIQVAVLDMVPKDLAVTESEMRDLQREVLKKLTGVFWEAIDRSEMLRSQKEHFYSNGIIYSTSIDVFLICGFAGFVYAVASLVTRKPDLAYVGAFSIAIALACRAFMTPRIRARHLALSAEQLDLLRREQSDFVSNRFREIIVGWRKERVLH